MAGVTLHPLQWVLVLIFVAATPVICAPYLKTAPGKEQPPLDHLFSPDQGLIGPLFRQNDYSLDPPTQGGCYYQFRHYDEGDRIVTNEPCLNCTCHNSMLMCYLKVCPFSKPIGQDCTIEKDPNQCCPVITCPQVPVNLQVMQMASLTTTQSPASTAVVPYSKHGCTIADEFYPDGAQVPGDPRNPCELCYCIRNHTACLMQECILKVEGCKPVFEAAICCPVRYMCEYEEDALLEITTTMSPMNETVITTIPPHVGGCTHNSEFYADGSLIPSEDPCEHCYCMKNDIVCAIQECRSPLDEDDENCVPRLPLPGKCCPEAYDCADTDATTTFIPEDLLTTHAPFGIEPILSELETEAPTMVTVEDKEIPIEVVEQTTLDYVTAEVVTVGKIPEVPVTTEKVTLTEVPVDVTTEKEMVTAEEDLVVVESTEKEIVDATTEREKVTVSETTEKAVPDEVETTEIDTVDTTTEKEKVTVAETTEKEVPDAVDTTTEKEKVTVAETTEKDVPTVVETTEIEIVDATTEKEKVTVADTTEKEVPAVMETTEKESVYATTEEEKVTVSETTEKETLTDAVPQLTTLSPDIIDKETEGEPAEITKSTGSDTGMLETRTTGPGDEMFLTTTPMSDETTFDPITEVTQMKTTPSASDLEVKPTEPTPKPIIMEGIEDDESETVPEDIEPKEPSTESTSAPDVTIGVTEPSETKLEDIDKIPTTTAPEEVDTSTQTEDYLLIETSSEYSHAITTLVPIEISSEAVEKATEKDLMTTTLSSLEALDVTTKLTTDVASEVTDISEITEGMEVGTTPGPLEPKSPQKVVTKKPVEGIPTAKTCSSNGKLYEDGETVPAATTCQDECICKNGVISCQQKACPPSPPAFLRCDVEQNSTECCPIYSCPTVEPDLVPSPNCVSNGKQYLEGEFIPSPDLCTDCYCLDKEIVCAYQECPAVAQECEPIDMQDGDCCPSKYLCPAIEVGDLVISTDPSVEVEKTTTEEAIEDKAEPTTTSKVEITEALEKTTPTVIDITTVKTLTETEQVPVETTKEPDYFTETSAPAVTEVTKEPITTTEKSEEIYVETTSVPEIVPIVTDITDIELTTVEPTVEITYKPVTEIEEVSTEKATLKPEIVKPTIPSEVDTTDVYATTISDMEPTTTEPEIETERLPEEMLVETTLKPEDDVKTTITAEEEVTKVKESTTVESLVESTTLEAITDVEPAIVVEPIVVVGTDGISDDGEEETIPETTEVPVDTTEPSTISTAGEITVEDIIVTTDTPVEYTSVKIDADTIKPTVKPFTSAGTTVSEEISTTAIPEIETEIYVSATDAPATEKPEIDIETEVSVTEKPETDIKTETPATSKPAIETETDVPVTDMPETDTETETPPTSKPAIEIEIPATSKPAIETVTDVPATDMPETDTETETPATSKPAIEIEVPATSKPEIEITTDLLTEIPLEVTSSSEATTESVDKTTIEVDETVIETTTKKIVATDKAPIDETDVTTEIPETKTEKVEEIPKEISTEASITTDTSKISLETSTPIVSIDLDEITTSSEVVHTEKVVLVGETTEGYTTPSLEYIPPSTQKPDTASTIMPLFEGCWWFDEQLYEHGDVVPSENVCQENCKCNNGTVSCQHNSCPPSPPSFLRCAESSNNDSCCPTFECAPTPTNLQCSHKGQVFEDNEYIPSDTLCQDCFCLEGEVVCAELVCGVPRPDCMSIVHKANECCPSTYECTEPVPVSANLTTPVTEEPELVEVSTEHVKESTTLTLDIASLDTTKESIEVDVKETTILPLITETKPYEDISTVRPHVDSLETTEKATEIDIVAATLLPIVTEDSISHIENMTETVEVSEESTSIPEIEVTQIPIVIPEEERNATTIAPELLVTVTEEALDKTTTTLDEEDVVTSTKRPATISTDAETSAPTVEESTEFDGEPEKTTLSPLDRVTESVIVLEEETTPSISVAEVTATTTDPKLLETVTEEVLDVTTMTFDEEDLATSTKKPTTISSEAQTTEESTESDGEPEKTTLSSVDRVTETILVSEETTPSIDISDVTKTPVVSVAEVTTAPEILATVTEEVLDVTTVTFDEEDLVTSTKKPTTIYPEAQTPEESTELDREPEKTTLTSVDRVTETVLVSEETTPSSEIAEVTKTPVVSVAEVTASTTAPEQLTTVTEEVLDATTVIISTDEESTELGEGTTPGPIEPKIPKQPTNVTLVEASVDGKCSSNGISYEEGDSVPISSICQEKCLCSNGTISCQQIACPSPPPAFLRCDAQENPKECCPLYDCPIIQPDPVPSPNCISNGQQYLEGEYVPSADSCTDCYCLDKEIICAYQECPQVEIGCKPIEMQTGNCCPSKYECPAMEVGDLVISTDQSVEVDKTTTEAIEDKAEPATTSKVEITEAIEKTTPTVIDITTVKTLTDTEQVPVEATKEPDYFTETPAPAVTEVTKEPITTTEKSEEIYVETTSVPEIVPIVTDIADIELTTVEPTVEITYKPVTEIEEVSTEKATQKPEIIKPTIPSEVDTTDVYATTISDMEPTTTEPEIETERLPEEMLVETTLKPEEDVKTTITAEEEVTKAKESTTVESLVESTTLEAITDVEPAIVVEPIVVVGTDGIADDGEEETIPETTEVPVDTTEPSTISTAGEITVEDIIVTTDAPVEYTSVKIDADTIKPTAKPFTSAGTTVSEEISTTAIPEIETEIYVSATDAPATEKPEIDIETEVSVTKKPETDAETPATSKPAIETEETTEAVEISTDALTEIPLEVTPSSEATTESFDKTTIEVDKMLTETATEATEIPIEKVTEIPLEVTPSSEATTESVYKTTLAEETATETSTKKIVPDYQTTHTPDALTTLIDEIDVTTDIPETQTEKVEEITKEPIKISIETTTSVDDAEEITTISSEVEITTTSFEAEQTEKDVTPATVLAAVDLTTQPTVKEPVTTSATTEPDLTLIETTITPIFEGCWWFNDQLYEHGDVVPSNNTCQENCKCTNGTVRCQREACPSAPPSFLRCTELLNNDTCCPTYECAPSTTSLQCLHQGKSFEDGDYIPSETICQDCYCVEGQVACAVLECGLPHNDCVPIKQRTDECCPASYECIETFAPESLTTPLVAVTEEETTTAITTPTTPVTSVQTTTENVTLGVEVKVTPEPEVVTGLPEDDETHPEEPEIGGAYIPPTTMAPTNETTTWSPTTTPAFLLGPGSCLFNSVVYVSAQQIPRDDPCDFCFCFRGDIICLQQTCPPPIPGCYEEAISGFCCPRYECPVKQSVIEITTTTTPYPSFPPQYKTSRETVCEVDGTYYPVGQVIPEASSPCHECICGKDGFMKCLPKECDSHRKLTIHGYR